MNAVLGHAEVDEDSCVIPLEPGQGTCLIVQYTYLSFCLTCQTVHSPFFSLEKYLVTLFNLEYTW